MHELIISSRYGGGGDYGETLATFTGSRSLFSGEKRRIERVFGEIYKDLRVMYERDKEKRRAEGLKKERRKSEEIRDKLRKTFK